MKREYCDFRYERGTGNIILTFPGTTETVYLQSDDVAIFEDEADKVKKIWARKYGRGYRKKFGPFNSYEEHMSVIIDQYSMLLGGY